MEFTLFSICMFGGKNNGQIEYFFVNTLLIYYKCTILVIIIIIIYYTIYTYIYTGIYTGISIYIYTGKYIIMVSMTLRWEEVC